MRKLFFSFMSVLTLAILAVSCTGENESGLDNPKAVAELSFEVNLLGNPNEATKTIPSPIGKCATHEELTNLANQNNLTLNVTINEIVYNTKIRWTGSKFVADPILLAAGDYSATEATVTNGINVLFSAVASESPYASYVPELLPKNFKVGGEIPLYQKTSLDLYMMCVLKEKPKDFGFVKWNINFTQVYCVSFIINMCKDEEHFIASGSLNIKNGTYVNDKFIPATGNETPVKWAKIDNTVSFSSASNTLAELCFADNYNIDNDEEWYMFTLTINTPISKTYIGYANVNTLLNYNLVAINDAWDAKNNVIHFNFCDNKTWFFYDADQCEGIDQIIIDIESYISNLSVFDNLIQTQLPDHGFEKGLNCLDIKYDYWHTPIGLIIPKGTKIRIMNPIRLTEGIVSYANILYPPLYEYTEIDAVYNINIYTDEFAALYRSFACTYSIYYGKYTETGMRYSTDAPVCLYGDTNCFYYIEFEFTKAMNTITKIMIDKAPDNICPIQSWIDETPM